jgi:hypothetical protein
MFERKFLAYILYITLIEIRESAYIMNDSKLFNLADLVHNIPFSLLDEELAKLEYDNLLEAVEFLKITEWLENRKIEFKNRFPEFE